jgi:hypothetical protein
MLFLLVKLTGDLEYAEALPYPVLCIIRIGRVEADLQAATQRHSTDPDAAGILRPLPPVSAKVPVFHRGVVQ